MDQDLVDRLAIRDLVENWALWRDAGFWEKFRTCWHDDGIMMATWFQGTGDEFIEVNKKGFASDVSILHFLGGTAIPAKGMVTDNHPWFGTPSFELRYDPEAAKALLAVAGK